MNAGQKEVYRGNTKDDDNNLFVARGNNYALQTNDKSFTRPNNKYGTV